MADDVTLPGTGVPIVTDDIGGGRQLQLVKPAFGDDGLATMVSPANPFPVSDVALVATASATATGGYAQIDAQGCQSAMMQLTGTWVGTVSIQWSPDGSTWNTANMWTVNFNNSSTSPAVTNANSSYTVNGGYYAYIGIFPSMRYVRVNVSAYTSGTINIRLSVSRGFGPLTPVALVGNLNSNIGVSLNTSTTTANDGDSNSVSGRVGAFNASYNGTTFDRHRLAKIFKSATATASGDTAVWTPTNGKRFQLLAFKIFVTAHAAQTAAGTITVTLRDATTSTGLAIPVYVPGTAGAVLGGWDSGWIDLGPYGFRSSAINQALNVNLSAALTAGAVGVIAVGTEE